jgi:hypothetical protein
MEGEQCETKEAKIVWSPILAFMQNSCRNQSRGMGTKMPQFFRYSEGKIHR